MLVSDLFRLSFHNLLLHKIRSLLTSLGVIFGVGSVISMLAVSEGAKRKALSQIEAMGIDKIIVYSKKPPLAGKDSSTSNASFTETYGLTVRDRKHIVRMDNIDHVTPVRDSRFKVMKGTKRLDLKLVGVGSEFCLDSGCHLLKGRWFKPVDFVNIRNVCVIGERVKRKMFRIGQRDIIGLSIRVGRHLFRIIGIIGNDHGTQYPELGSPNDMIYIPMRTSEAICKNYAFVREGRNAKVTIIDYDLLVVSVLDVTHIDNTAKRITAYMRKTHTETKDWGVLVPLDLLKQRERTQNIFTIVMGSIAGISLIVGGIGIMNIMLASVYERRKEIGTRRALGAQKRDILLQFLIETVFLTSLGGIIGIGVGVGISQVITIYADMPTVYEAWSIILSLLISGFVGVVFGTYPAWKAAQQNPIDVLRSE
ncbi:ABC transporter permease [Lentisphaerota bacterium ZTH]|nr:ABC transporter permease [Lentisphaerota bacterium]WET05497.1 ABC transporter permease [Lentisphaerota bacterium ZTH]